MTKIPNIKNVSQMLETKLRSKMELVSRSKFELNHIRNPLKAKKKKHTHTVCHTLMQSELNQIKRQRRIKELSERN